MRYEEWEALYKEILSDFGFSKDEDRKSAEILERLIDPVSIELLAEKIGGNVARVYGAGPSLEKITSFPLGTRIAADGATSYLLEKDVLPDIVVTDLDGRVDDLIRASEMGSITVLHAHGDNVREVERYAGAFKNAIGTTQGRPFGRLHNFGGFTDGDRAVFMAAHFGAKKIYLYGMDFRGNIGRYSFSEDTPTKRKKLLWAERLIGHLAEKGAKIRYVR